nr:uncharacterized protein LOC109027887 [Gorilla gorilla gorilla]
MDSHEIWCRDSDRETSLGRSIPCPLLHEKDPPMTSGPQTNQPKERLTNFKSDFLPTGSVHFCWSVEVNYDTETTRLNPVGVICFFGLCILNEIFSLRGHIN